MAGQPNEVMRFELDTAQAEAKTRNLIELLGKVAIAGANKQDTSGLERQISSEVETLSRSTGKTKEAQSAIDAVIKSKEKLGSVVAILGGQFGGMVGQLGNIVELFMNLGKAAVLPAAVLAAATAVVAVFNNVGEAARKAKEETEKLAEAERVRREAGKSATGSMAEKRAAVGLFGGAQDATERSRKLQEGGLSADLADFQVMARDLGLSEEDAAAAMRGYLVSGKKADLGTDQRKNELELRGLVRRGQSPEAVGAEEAWRRDTGEAARQASYKQQVLETSTTNYADELNKFIEEEGLNEQQAERLRAYVQYKTTGKSSGKKVGADTVEAGDRFLESGRARTEFPPEPSPTTIVNIQTVYGVPPIHGDATSSVAQRSPGSTNGARAITP